MVDRWERRYGTLAQQFAAQEPALREAGEVAAARVSQGALGAFFALLLGALATMLGAWLYILVEDRRRGFSRRAAVLT